MDLLEALRGQAEQAEVYTIEGEATVVSFEANTMKAAKVDETRGIALRALVNGRLGFTAASGAVAEEDLVANLLASARYGEEVKLAFPGPAAGPEVATYDPSLAEVPLARLVEIGQEIVATLRATDPNAHVNVDLEREISTTSLRNSAGAEVRARRSILSLGVSVERVRGDDVLIAYETLSDISLTEAYRQAVERLAEKVRLASRVTTLRSGRMPVLFAPSGALVLLLPLMLALNGQHVQRGTSPLATRRGERVLADTLTLWDDPTLPGRPASGSHDGEGVPCARKPLIEGGICRGFLFDLRTAALAGAQSTGNGARGLFAPPTPAPSNLVLQPGETPLARMLAGIQRGLLVEEVLGLGQGNPLSGAFSNPVGLGYLIERGEIVGRVKDVSISGNIYQDLRQLAALSQESYWVRGQLKLPYILLGELNVVCRER
jgi:PmbA protein